MANKKDGFLQKAKRQMKKKGTIGAFTDYCGGKVTDQCIERAMNSNNDTLRRRAQFAKNMRNMKTGGEVEQETAKKLPGGVMQPIGYGAFKFHGNKHDEAGMGSDSGIILEEGGKKEPGLEVEDGELQVDVDTTEGEKEYIVSDYIKNPATGNTLAEDLERELKRAKNNMEAAKITARYVRLNEELRGSDGDPSKIKAQEGQFAEDSGYVMPADSDSEGYEIAPEGSQARDFVEGQSRTELGTYEKEGEKVGTDEVAGLKENNPWFDWENFDPSKSEDVERFQKEYNEKAPEDQQIKVDGKLGAQTASAYVPYKQTPEGPKPEDPSEWDVGNFEEPVDESEPAPEETAPTEEAPVEEAAPEAEGDPAKFRPRMTGTMLQALGPLAALNKDFTAKSMAPAYAKEIRMGRVNLDPERAAAAQQTQAGSAGISAGLAGPAAFAMQQKNLAAGQQSQRGITDQENRANIQIANREKGTNVGIRRGNQQASMTAGQFNVGQQNKAQAMNVQKDINAMNQLGKIGTQTVKDYNQQYANFGSDIMQYGAPAADYYANVYKGNTPFGMGSRDISISQMDPAEVSAMYNQQNQQTQAESTPPPPPPPVEEEARRGRYIKKSNKVRRKKRRKK